MQPISVSAVENRNGVLTIYVLMDDGTILKKSENDTRWHEIENVDATKHSNDKPKTDAVPGHRDQQPSKPDLASGNKGRKKRGS